MYLPKRVFFSTTAAINTITVLMQTGIGITPRSQPVPKKSNVVPKPVILAPPVHNSVKPRAIINIHSVAIKGGTLNRVIISPLKRPSKEPKSPAITIDPGTVTPTNKFKGGNSIPFFNKPAAKAPLKANIEPTERSIPPVSITIVMPTDRHALTETCLIIVQKLSSVLKSSYNTPKNKIIKNKAINDCNFSSLALCSFNPIDCRINCRLQY